MFFQVWCSALNAGCPDNKSRDKFYCRKCLDFWKKCCGIGVEKIFIAGVEKTALKNAVKKYRKKIRNQGSVENFLKKLQKVCRFFGLECCGREVRTVFEKCQKMLRFWAAKVAV